MPDFRRRPKQRIDKTKVGTPITQINFQIMVECDQGKLHRQNAEDLQKQMAITDLDQQAMIQIKQHYESAMVHYEQAINGLMAKLAVVDVADRAIIEMEIEKLQDTIIAIEHALDCLS